VKSSRTRKWLLTIAACISVVAVIQIIRHHWRPEERRLRSALRESVQSAYPDTVKELSRAFGLRPYKSSPPAGGTDGAVRRVLLVHGVDDPGKVWMNLAPALVEAGWAVWILTYPNDQPIAASARFFLEQLQSRLPPADDPVAIVAHSMGGLVTREMLTAPELAFAGRAAGGGLPRVGLLVMVATPNHGAALARFRIFTELREQTVRLQAEDYHWLQGLVDGAGEAGIDMTPGSAFLTALNRRPHPPGVDMLVIAGVMSPLQRQTLGGLLQLPADGSPEQAREAAPSGGQAVLQAVAGGIGDGLVSVDAARLDGIPFAVVEGTHLSIIRNLFSDSERVPPAVPLVIETLANRFTAPDR
jgi:pimeloyl-ACP methyl ester carboxylesterase